MPARRVKPSWPLWLRWKLICAHQPPMIPLQRSAAHMIATERRKSGQRTRRGPVEVRWTRVETADIPPPLIKKSPPHPLKKLNLPRVW